MRASQRFSHSIPSRLFSPPLRTRTQHPTRAHLLALAASQGVTPSTQRAALYSTAYGSIAPLRSHCAYRSSRASGRASPHRRSRQHAHPPSSYSSTWCYGSFRPSHPPTFA